MQKKQFVLMGLALCVAVLGLATSANFVAVTRTRNRVTTGNVSVQLVQKAMNENNQMIDFKPEQLRAIVPNTRYSQMPYVENVGTEDFYTRVFVKTTITAADGKTILPNVLQFDVDPTKWMLDKEGYYRYIGIVKTGERTPVPLFTSVYFPPEMDNAYLNATMEITLMAQAVQAEYNTYEDSVLEVEGWPAITQTTRGTTEEVGTL